MPSSSPSLLPSLSSQPTLMPSKHPSLMPSISPSIVPSLSPSTSAIPSLSSQPSAAPSDWVCSQILINVKTDEFPSDTTWHVSDSNNNMIYSGGPYTNSYTDHIFEACLNEGFYEFKIFDAYGDGILGDSGYTIRINDEVVKEGGGSGGFQVSEEHSFIITRPSIPPSMTHYPSHFPSNNQPTYSTHPSLDQFQSNKPTPSVEPLSKPSVKPSADHSLNPSSTPSMKAYVEPSSQPSLHPSLRPSSFPSVELSNEPSVASSDMPSFESSDSPSSAPSAKLPSTFPTVAPSIMTTDKPSVPISSIPTVYFSNSPSIHHFSKLPSIKPSMSPTINPSAILTNELMQCAPKNQRSKQCGAKGGESICCSGLVCHQYQTWRCVEKKHKTCAGPNTFSGQCGSSYKHAVPNCCAGLACKEKRCVPTMLESPSVPQDSCKKEELNLILLFKTDMHSKWQNKIQIEEKVDMKWLKIIKKIEDFPNNDFLLYGTCLSKLSCYRLKIIDSESNGICCQDGIGWYDVLWGGDKVPHDPFTDGTEQMVMFGNCS